jgi:GNAT superfamily N-acetyltransferase
VVHIDVHRASAADASAVADVWLRSFASALPTVAKAHSDDDVRAWIREVVMPHRETWVATVDGAVAAMMVLDVGSGSAAVQGAASGDAAHGAPSGRAADAAGEIDQLYVDPPSQGHGLGSRLVDVAKQRCPAGLELWTFQVNVAAQRFYERHGFVAIGRTDGSGNEEHEPDVRYRWSRARP